MTSHSEESRHHYSFLLETTSKLKYETHVNLFSADGKVAATMSPLVLGASSLLLKSCLEEGGDAIVLPDFSYSSIAIFATCLLHPLSYLDNNHVQLLESIAQALSIPLPCLNPPLPAAIGYFSSQSETSDWSRADDKGTVIDAIENSAKYDGTDDNGNNHYTQESVAFGSRNTPIPQDWTSNNNSTGNSLKLEEEKITLTSEPPDTEDHAKGLFCSLCHTTCRDAVAMEIHLAQHCEVQAHFGCDDCRQSFSSLVELSLHCREKHSEVESASRLQHLLLPSFHRRFQCQRCEKQFGTRVQLKHHMNIHLGLKPYSCKECGKAFTQPTHLSVHRRIHNGVKPYMCSICGKTFAIASNMRKHAAIHERDGTDHQIPFEAEPAVVPQFEPVAVQPFSCNHCEMRFSALKKLAMHERREHGSQHLCPQPGCQRVCISSSQLQKHLLTHSGEKPHGCPICQKMFSQKAHVTQHMATVHVGPGEKTKTHVCPQCGKCFVSKGVLAKHMMLHTNQRPHQCSVCSKAFVQKSHLTAHMNQHTGKRPFTCSECGKAFTTKQHLKDHLKLHNNSKPWLVCTQCPARYRGQTDLTIHMRTHTGETPFPCTNCGKRFRSERSLENHKRIHSGLKPFLCDNCDKRFTTPSGLRQHFKHNPKCKESAKPGSFSSRGEDKEKMLIIVSPTDENEQVRQGTNGWLGSS